MDPEGWRKRGRSRSPGDISPPSFDRHRQNRTSWQGSSYHNAFSASPRVDEIEWDVEAFFETVSCCHLSSVFTKLLMRLMSLP